MIKWLLGKVKHIKCGFVGHDYKWIGFKSFVWYECYQCRKCGKIK